MKSSKIFVTLVLFFSAITFSIFISCCGSQSEDYWEMKKKQRALFYSSISEKQKNIVQKFFKGQIKYGINFTGINQGFYCLWKERDKDIYPHSMVNEKLKKEGYNITCNKDRLKFIIVSETVSHNVGQYTGGGTATQIETIISVIDIRNEIAYKVKDVMGGMPPESIRSRSRNAGGVGSSLDEDDIRKFIIYELVKK